MQIAFAFDAFGAEETPAPEMAIEPDNYDHVIVAFSGGKDSVACVLGVTSRFVRQTTIWQT